MGRYRELSSFSEALVYCSTSVVGESELAYCCRGLKDALVPLILMFEFDAVTRCVGSEWFCEV